MPAQTLPITARKRFRNYLGAAFAVTPLLVVVTLIATQTSAGHSAHAAHGDAPDAAQRAAIAEQQFVPLAGSEFRANCASSHRAGNDPIVFPNQPNVSHIHEFFGNRTTNASSTLQSLRAGTTNCQPSTDLSAYWVPTVYKNGIPVAPESVTIYYQGIHNAPQAVTPPQGLRIVVGTASAANPDQNPAARWSCVGQGPSSRDFMNCPPGTKLETYLDFPTCWNGRDLDSPNHKDHMAFAPGLVCPSSHPVVLPRTVFLITYPVNGGGLTLAGTRNGVNVTNAPGYTFHGDFMNAWNPAELERRMRDCIRVYRICGTNGNPI
jgi:hypothetical protein